MTRHPFRLEDTASESDAFRLSHSDSTNIVELNRIYRCSKEELFSYFVNPDKLTRWMANSVQGEIVPGGMARLIWNENTVVDIEFEKIVTDSRIELLMIDKLSVNTRVVLKFHRHDKFSFLRLSHFFPVRNVDCEKMLMLRCKWTFFLDNLASVCESRFDQRPLKADEDGWRWLKN